MSTRTFARPQSLAIAALLLAGLAPFAPAQQAPATKSAFGKSRAETWCGTSPYRAGDTLLDHEANAERLARTGLKQASAARVTDVNNLAVVEDDDTLVVPVNAFDITKGKQIVFSPQGTTGFTMSQGKGMLEKGGTKLTSFTGGGPGTPTDDGYQEVRFTDGFRFSFYGQTYDRVFVGTNGFVTFGEGDFDSPVLVSASKLAGEQPRIALFWTDLDTTNAAVTVKQTATVVAITWKKVQVFDDNGSSGSNTFQLQLSKSGRVAMLYGKMTDSPDLVGLSPGGGAAPLRRVDLTSSQAVTGAPFETFSTGLKVDVPGLTQAFYKAHGDDYDFLYIWTDFPTDLGNAFAYYLPIRNAVTGIGSPLQDDGSSYGSSGRLQGVLNLNRGDLYPDDPAQPVPGLGLNSALSIFGQEQGHRWMSYVRFMDNGTPSTAILGRDLQHWSFFFDTESTLSTPAAIYSSSMEGNAIKDKGDGTFVTNETAINYYSELDQYLMGLRGPNEVRDMFLVTGARNRTPGDPPQNGVPMTGARRTIRVDDIVAAEGPRTPDVTTSQKQFRAGWIVLTRKGTTPNGTTLTHLNTLRTAWETYFNTALQGRGTLSTELLAPAP